MPVPFEVTNPAEAFPDRYPLYAELRDRTTISSGPAKHLPIGLTHVQRLDRPQHGWDSIAEVERFKKLDEELFAEEVLYCHALELQAFTRVRQLLGSTATEATVPLAITGDQQRHSFADVTAKVGIYVCKNIRRRKYFSNLDSLSLDITGTCTDVPDVGEERFRIHTTILSTFDHADRGQSLLHRVPGPRLLTLLQFNDALDFVDTYRAPSQ